MELPAVCPSCKPPAVLIPLGDRRDRCWPWRPWRTAITQLYLCDGCGAVVAVETPARAATRAMVQPDTRVSSDSWLLDC